MDVGSMPPIEYLRIALTHVGLCPTRHWCCSEKRFHIVAAVLGDQQEDADDDKKEILAHYDLHKFTRKEYRALEKYVTDDFTVNDKDAFLRVFEDVARKHGRRCASRWHSTGGDLRVGRELDRLTDDGESAVGKEAVKEAVIAELEEEKGVRTERQKDMSFDLCVTNADASSYLTI
ncbi:unnamed protein product [Vitrella brassicaformis CCMP3155]|uniref:Uncharacterized protein n=1 Tax=Vitrella brassicaformis (strain CCMP3155) TaxID=1169540 RepID=A0A0G4G1Z9_VITBC|nr:unnamed protein product [Vitrella brassicaformis CCMP3155]|eukprot:CEM21762.1 unnamed protein product [Vitrella brassicaformis CCMP3155]